MTPDWALIPAFLAVAETGSLSAAARRLGASQPTLGRQIRALESSLHTELFRRVPRGLDLTEAGAALLAPARAMAVEAARMARLAEARETGLAGTVRITASRVVSHYLLPPVIAGLRREVPEIRLDLVPSDETENLLFREADIALRMYPPEQDALIARRLRDLPLGVYAARGFLDRVGRPGTIAEALAAGFIGLDRSGLDLQVIRGLGTPAERDDFAVRTDDQPLHWRLIRAGCGIGVVQVKIADGDRQVERLLPDVPLPVLPMWIVAPAALRTTPRLRRVWDALADAFA